MSYDKLKFKLFVNNLGLQSGLAMIESMIHSWSWEPNQPVDEWIIYVFRQLDQWIYKKDLTHKNDSFVNYTSLLLASINEPRRATMVKIYSV